MKIAIDVSPLSSMSQVRGVGFYLKNLLLALKKYYPEHEYLEFSGKEVPKDADMVHYPYFDPFSLTLSLFSKRPTVVTVHDLTPIVLPNLFPVGLKGIAAWQIQKRLLKQVTRIITDSNASKQDIERLTGVKDSKIDAIYLAAAEQFRKISNIQYPISNLKKKYNLPERFALYVGDGTPNKNVVRLVQTCILAKVPLVIAGKVFTDMSVDLSHPWTREIGGVRNLAKDKNNAILLLGFVSDEDLVVLYNAASVFVMPSLYEGFGLPVVEAFSCGTPVVCSDKGSLKEVAKDASYIIDPYDTHNMAKGIKEVMVNKKLANGLSRSGQIRVKEFSWQKTAEATMISYQKVLSS